MEICNECHLITKKRLLIGVMLCVVCVCVPHQTLCIGVISREFAPAKHQGKFAPPLIEQVCLSVCLSLLLF